MLQYGQNIKMAGHHKQQKIDRINKDEDLD